MSERSGMSGNPAADAARLAKTLGRFTPNATGFDRDALLFQAGRASVQARRFWPTLAGLLILSQAATLVFLLGRAPEQPTPAVVSVPPNESPDSLVEPPSPPSDDPRQFAYRRALLSGDINDLPVEKTTDAVLVPDKMLSVLSTSSALSAD